MRRLALAALAAFACLGAPPAAAQLSPGPLSSAHVGLEGSANCLRCHAPREGVARERCLDCHTALAASIADGGLHARREYRQCETCHIEHHGRDFELVFWGDEGREAFDHAKTGWPLAGAHREAGCRDCHRPAHLDDLRRLERGGADPQTTFLGLDASCLTCHRDEHRGQLGREACLDCHTQSAWKPAPGFDHSRAEFALTGAHREVACGECHPTRQEGGALAAADPSFLVFRGIEHDSCADCHRDPHQGRLGASCASCHATDDFRRVDRAAFDHDRTRFPLAGEHRSVACSSCHAGGATGKRLAFGSCSDCHRDPHQGRLGGACADCHDPSGWGASARSRAQASGFDHDRTRFPLLGAHRAVACAGCHGSRPATDRLAFGACSDCHRDPHLGQLARAAGGGACSDCHTVERFVPSTFGLDEHQASDFPLDGAHRAVACIDCHRLTEPETLPGALRPISPRRADRPVRRFVFADTSCEACHGDPHGGTTRAVAGSCADCHATAGWSRVAFAGHAATGFALDGGHAGVACADCHPRGASADPGTLDFGGAPESCAGCHLDPHFGTGDASLAQRVAAVDCADCHAIEAFRPARFEHARDAGFALEGAHRSLACAACHDPGAPGGETAIAPLPTSCEGCHGGSVISRSSADRVQ